MQGHLVEFPAFFQGGIGSHHFLIRLQRIYGQSILWQRDQDMRQANVSPTTLKGFFHQFVETVLVFEISLSYL